MVALVARTPDASTIYNDPAYVITAVTLIAMLVCIFIKASWDTIQKASPSRLQRVVRGKTVIVTGASDGIGAHLAPRLGAAGAKVILIARTEERLKMVGDQIRAEGGEAHEYIVDLSNDEDCYRAVDRILAERGHVDIFVSNAGRSIRRSAKYQVGERFHDFRRLMALNFFGALRMILGVLPSMFERKSGHIVHVSSFGVPTRQPRFAGYCATKSALDAALQSMAGEVASQGIHISSVYMPLVQTKMVESNGHSYDHVFLLTVDMACELIEHAIITKDMEVIDIPSRFMALLFFFRPSLVVEINSLVYGLETEHPPNGLAFDKILVETEKTHEQSKKPRSPVLKALGTLFSSFSYFNILLMRIGMTWVRDPLIILVILLVLVVHSIIVAVMTVVRFVCNCSTSERAKPQENDPKVVCNDDHF